MKNCRLLLGCGLLLLAGFVTVGFAQEDNNSEITLSDREIGRLDIFEDRAISKADAAFARGEYAQAGKAYGTFIEKFPDSSVAAYALLRKARCADLDDKRAEAIEDYKTVVERFPKVVKYAVPALSSLAECYAKDGADDEAMKVWQTLADSADYSKSPAAAEAIIKLAETLSGQGKHDDALKYYVRVAVSSQGADDEFAQQAIKNIVRQHVRTAPDEAKLREIYVKIRPAEDSDVTDPGQSPAYWSWVAEAVSEHGTFGWSEREAGKKYFENWIGILDGKYPDSDDFQIALANLQYKADRDRAKLAERLDGQFQKHHKKGDWKRVLKWIRAYRGNWTKTREYAAMLDFETAGIDGVRQMLEVLNEQQESYLAKSSFQKFCENLPFEKLSNDDIRKLILLAHETLNDSSTAKNLAGKLHLDKMTEEQKLQLAREFLELDGSIAQPIYDGLQDQGAAKLELFEHYCASGDSYKAIALADELAKLDKYAATIREKKAELLVAGRRYTEAIAAYTEAGNPPANLWKIVDCYVALEEPDKAIEKLREIEAGFKDEAAKAAYRIACLYRDAEEKQKQIPALRDVIEKYPGSDEAREAKKELDDLGIPPALPDDPLGF
jgi:TolA-binding protein